MKAVQIPYDAEIAAQRAAWDRKPLLREIYARYFDRLAEALTSCGPTLEIGAGGGYLGEHLALRGIDAGLVRSDVFLTRWVDLVADAQALPLRDDSLRNIVGLDVLHHLPDPLAFFAGAQRVLAPGGRLALIEPYISLWGYLVYRFLHHEACILSDDPWGPRPAAEEHNWANGALPWLLLARHRERFAETFPGLRLARLDWFDCIGYPASGGFNYRARLPAPLVRLLLRAEEWIPRALRRSLTAIRCLLVLEKQPAGV